MTAGLTSAAGFPSAAASSGSPANASSTASSLQQVVGALAQAVDSLKQLVISLNSTQTGGGPLATSGTAGSSGAMTGCACCGKGTSTSTATGVAGAMGGPTAPSGAMPVSTALTSLSHPNSTNTGTHKPSAAAKPSANPAASGPANLRNRSGVAIADISVDQFDPTSSLSDSDKGSACGPAAAASVAHFVGKTNVTLDDAVAEAKKVGWNVDEGMQGPASEVQLLHNMGIKAHQESIDWDKIKKTVQSGVPVIIDTPQHYWVAEQYNPKTGKFNFGHSGSVFKGSNGKTWYSPDEMAAQTGAARAAIYLDPQ